MNSEDRDTVRFEHEAIILIENPYGLGIKFKSLIK